MDDKNPKQQQSTEELITESQRVRARTRELIDKCKADKAQADQILKKIAEEWEANKDCEKPPEPLPND